MIDSKKFRHYEEYETNNHGKVKLLKYKNETKNKRKVCQVGADPIDFFFIAESELIPQNSKRKKYEFKRTPIEAQREFQKEMIDKGYKQKTFFISGPNLKKLESLKEKSGLKKWNDFMNHLIDQL